jgi:hypothetical protein
MTSGISWVFSQVEEAIILEDDCLPSATWFPFASEMLSRYRNEPKVMMVSGFNPFADEVACEYSYSYSRSVGIWGWATWARAWRHFDQSMEQWPLMRRSGALFELLNDVPQAEYWTKLFKWLSSHDSGWDYRWQFSVLAKNGLAIWPSQHLVRNIGFDVGVGSTSGVTVETPWVRRIVEAPLGVIRFPLSHPPTITPNRQFDAVFFERAHKFQVPQGRLIHALKMLKQGDLSLLRDAGRRWTSRKFRKLAKS